MSAQIFITKKKYNKKNIYKKKTGRECFTAAHVGADRASHRCPGMKKKIDEKKSNGKKKEKLMKQESLIKE